jgi:hypothetical protein
MGFYHPLDGVTNLKYKLLYFLTPNKKISERKALAFNRDRCCHLALGLWLILFHCVGVQCGEYSVLRITTRMPQNLTRGKINLRHFWLGQ